MGAQRRMPLGQQTPPPDQELARIERPRFAGRLFGVGAAPITVVVGPPGAGKSELIRACRVDPRAIYFQVGNENATFGRFVHGLARAVAPIAPGAEAAFPRVWERALQSRSPGIVLAHWLAEHLLGIDRPIVLDDLHAAAADPSIAAFIGKIAELRPDAPLTITLRSAGALPIPLWMAKGRMERPIDEADLRFDRSEVGAAARRFDLVLSAAEIDTIIAATGGSAIALNYALTRLRCDPSEFARVGMPTSFEGVAERIFARRTGAECAFLFSAALFPSIDDQLLASAGWDTAPATRDAIGADGPFIWERQTDGGIHFHDRFRDYLARQFEAYDPDFRSRIAHLVVQSLRDAGRHANALEVATRQRLCGAVGRLLDEHGFAILESGEVDVISEALNAFATDQRLGSRAMALRGYIDARRGRLDTSEAWFRLGLENGDDEVSRVTIAMYYARELALQRRADSCDVLAPFADSTTLPGNLLIDVQSSFAQALTAANRLDEARSRTEDALAMLTPDCAPALRARVFARAAYVALEGGQFSLARERARIAAPLAVAQSLYDVAASTYSVLYSIAYEIDDDAALSLDYLRCVRDLGLKSGTLRLELYALLGMYELHAETGDETALAEVEHELGALDKHDAAAQIIECLVPAKALQAGWGGGFDETQRLLRSTVERQATPAHLALCWAQIGLACAAAGKAEAATDALASAREALAANDTGTTRFGLTLLTLALASWVRGDAAGARCWTAAADDIVLGAAPRLRALRGVLEALVVGSTDPASFAPRVRDALGELRAAAFGGFAKLIEALPIAASYGAGESETIGSRLAKSELAERFAAALEAGDAAPVTDWLLALRCSPIGADALVAQFDGWAADRVAGDGVARRARSVRRQLSVHRPPTPAIVRIMDDVDPHIDVLFEHLHAAAPLMAEHSRAVSAWCSRIARALGLPESEILFISRCGLIHDVGKTLTPQAILDAPRGLSEDEWSIMREHAAEGGRMVARLAALAHFEPIVRGHHERLDGKGYPDGLHANAIPLAARIVSVADSFNAMIGRRAYRLPMVPTDALGELERGRGTQFDPDIVDVMIRIVLGRVAELPPAHAQHERVASNELPPRRL